MFFVTKERVLRQLSSLAADVIEFEEQAEALVTRFVEADELLCEFEELVSFRQKIDVYRQTISGTLASVMAFGATK